MTRKYELVEYRPERSLQLGMRPVLRYFEQRKLLAFQLHADFALRNKNEIVESNENFKLLKTRGYQ